jgi:hypothetical protein
MSVRSVLPCRVHDTSLPDNPGETGIPWQGMDDVVSSVGVPARLTAGQPVALPALVLYPSTIPVRITWEADDIHCEWHAALPPVGGDPPNSAVIQPDANSELTCFATVQAADRSDGESSDVYPRLHIEQLPFEQWFANGTLAGSAAAGVLAAVSAIWLLVGGGFTALAMLILTGGIAAALSPRGVRAISTRMRIPLPIAPRRVGSVSLPSINVEPTIERSEFLEDSVVRSYRTEVLKQTKSLHLLGLSVPIGLDTGYVPVLLRDRRAARQSATIPQETFTEIDRLINADMRLKGLLEGETLTPEEMWRSHQNLTVIGEVGAGKTTMLRSLSRRLAEGPLQWVESVPVLLELHRLGRADELAERPLDVLRDAVVDRFLEVLSGDVETEFDDAVQAGPDDDTESLDSYNREDVGRIVDGLLENGELTLLLDALDEVSAPGGEDEKVATSVIEAIRAIPERWPDIRIVVTCRQASGERYSMLPESFTISEVVPFDDAAIHLFVQRYFTERPERAVRLLDELAGNPRIRGLAATPLFLALITMVFERRGSLPQRRSEIYRRCVDLLLHEWDQRRGRDRHSTFVVEHKEEFLRRLSWNLHSSGARFISYDDVIRQLEVFAPAVGLSTSDAANLLDEIVSHHGLLRRYDEGWYGFVHFALQEFYTAECIERSASLQEAVTHRHRAWWQEILRLYAGRGDATALVMALLGEEEDYFRTNLRLAAECLAEQPAVKPSLRHKVLDALLEAARECHVPQLDRRLWRGLIQAGGPEIQEYAWEEICDQKLPLDVRLDMVGEMSRWSPGAYVEMALRRMDSPALDSELRTALIRFVGSSGERAGFDALLGVVADPSKSESARVAAANVLAIPSDDHVAPMLSQLYSIRRLRRC